MMTIGSNKPDGVIVIGGYINGLGIIRSFSEFGIRTAVICTKAYDLAQYSNCIEAHESALELGEKPECLTEVLARRSALWKGWALFPANDEALAAVSRCRHLLEADYTILAPSGEIAQYFLDKELMLKTAQDSGIPVPKCYGNAVSDTVNRVDFDFPVIVKPIVSYRFSERFGCKVLVAHDRLELTQAVSRVEEEGIACQIYDIVPGPDSSIFCHCLHMGADGVPGANLTVQKIRQSPPFFGVSRVARLVPHVPGFNEALTEFLRRIRFRGVAIAEFKLDPRDGTFRLLEINGRSVLYNLLLRKGGMDLAALAWSEYTGEHLGSAEITHWPGVWINLHADLFHSVYHRRNENLKLKDYFAPYMLPKMEAVWSSRDPKPFLVQWARTVRRGARLLNGRFSSSNLS